MNTKEFSDSFDTLLNSYAIQAGFGEESSKNEITLDEYEKSVLLTEAQDIIVKSYFDKNLNPQGQGFDDTIRRQVDFSSLIQVATIDSTSGNTFDENGILFSLPKRTVGGTELANSTDVLFILNEKLQHIANTSGTKTDYVIVPLNYREYDREKSKAYGQPLKRQAWRLFQNTATGFDIKSEVIPIWNLPNTGTFKYKIRYVRRPNPIVLVDLPDTSIDGVSVETDCELNPILHSDILNKAVEIAVATRFGNRQQPSAKQ